MAKKKLHLPEPEPEFAPTPVEPHEPEAWVHPHHTPPPVEPGEKHAAPIAQCPVCGSAFDASKPCPVDGWAGGH